MSTVYAYIRVSTKDQNEARQVDEILKLGITKENIVIEKASGKNFNRSKYLRLFKNIKTDDTLYIHSIDRLGRDYDEILEQWHLLTKKKKVIIKILDTPLLNTDNKPQALIDKYIKDITLLSLAFHAEQEWHNNKARQAGGIEAAKKTGKHLGRPKKQIELTEKEISIYISWKRGELTTIEAMQKLKFKKSMFYSRACQINWQAII